MLKTNEKKKILKKLEKKTEERRMIDIRNPRKLKDKK